MVSTGIGFASLSSLLLHAETNHKPRLLPKKRRPIEFRPRAAKLPSGVEMPKVEPKLTEPLFGFTKTAETWNSRACMIGIIGTFIVELMIGFDVGKGLNLPL